jgi:bacillolysin
MRRVSLPIAVVILLVAWHSVTPVTRLKSQARVQSVAPQTSAALRDWDNTVNSMLRTRELQVRLQRPDTLIPGRTIEQLDQYHNGVRVWGAGLTRQLDASSIAVSVFGTLYSDITTDTVPSVSQEVAKTIVERGGGTNLGSDRALELVIVPMDDGAFRLAWVGEIVTPLLDHLRLFIDAKSGAIVRQESLREGQAPNAYVGHGIGVLGDDKKLSTEPLAGTFITFDTLRPPDISTYDLRSNLTRAVQILNGLVQPTASDYSTGANNVWNDPEVVDAHAYSSYTYDYYYKRFGRRGLDNADKRIWNVTHLVRRSDIFAATDLDPWLNASYFGNGLMYYGEGCVCTFFGQRYNYLSGAIDIVAHELTHGVTQYTSNLLYQDESGALNEAFSDIMGTSVEFFFQPAGSGPMKADYLIGEDVITAGLPGTIDGIRSMENPALYGQPDHYSKRFIGPADAAHDNGGVHINSGIANQAFYLAIEGGTNRTSGMRVQGVGGTNRVQIEKVFYRAFAQLMPANTNFAMARLITLQAAQDLYGLNSAPFNAVRDAWTAVGVN